MAELNVTITCPECGHATAESMPLRTQVTLPKMKAGGLDVSFMIVYVGQPNPAQVPDALQPAGYDRAYKTAVAKFDAVHRLTKDLERQPAPRLG